MATPRFPAGPDGRLRRAIGRARWRMATVMGTEDLLFRAAPLLGVGALFLVLSWFGYFRLVPDWLRLWTLAVLSLSALASLWPLARLARPTANAIDARLEHQNRIVHQAVAIQDESLGNDDPFARALWLEHKRRMVGRIDALSAGAPRTDLPVRDPWGIRVALALLLVTAFAYSFSGSSGRVGDAFVGRPGAAAPEIRVDAWISPPPYISAAPIFLTGNGDVAPASPRAVEGSRVTVRVGAAPDQAEVTWVSSVTGEATRVAPQNPADDGDPAAPAHASVFEHQPKGDGTLQVTTASGSRDWAISVIPDEPPALAFVDEPRRAANGALELDYTITDDHGVVGAEADIAPLEDPGPDAVPLYDKPVYRLTLPRRNSSDGRATASQDLTEHPLAGQKVRITLYGTDGAGQTGSSETIETVLPARRFSEPLAAAVVEQRGVLALDARNLPRVFALHDALTLAPEETIPNLTHYLLLQSVRGRLETARDETDLHEALAYMWSVALQIEDGNLSLAARNLRDSQQALAEALENGATDEEIARLMDELRQAMNEYLQELARQAPQGENAQNDRMAENVLRQRDLDNLLDQIENLARSGARDQAQQLLSELQRMMNNLQAGRQQQMQQQGGPMREQMDQLGELMRRQQQLMDQTFDLEQQMQDGQQGEQGEPGQQGLQQQGEGQNGQSLEEMMGELGNSQQALREQLEQLQKELEGMGMQPSEGFGEAGEAMGDATGNLEGGQPGNALSDQGRALQALRQGARDMMSQMMQAMGNQPGSEDGPGELGPGNSGPDDRDPLGRPRATTGPDFGNRVKVPDEIEIQRAREILDAIRKRLGDRMSPQLEKDYLERLLDLR